MFFQQGALNAPQIPRFSSFFNFQVSKQTHQKHRYLQCFDMTACKKQQHFQTIFHNFSAHAPPFKNRSFFTLFLPPPIQTQEGVKSGQIATLHLNSAFLFVTILAAKLCRLSGPQNAVNYDVLWTYLAFYLQKTPPQAKADCVSASGKTPFCTYSAGGLGCEVSFPCCLVARLGRKAMDNPKVLCTCFTAAARRWASVSSCFYFLLTREHGKSSSSKTSSQIQKLVPPWTASLPLLRLRCHPVLLPSRFLALWMIWNGSARPLAAEVALTGTGRLWCFPQSMMVSDHGNLWLFCAVVCFGSVFVCVWVLFVLFVWVLFALFVFRCAGLWLGFVFLLLLLLPDFGGCFDSSWFGNMMS